MVPVLSGIDILLASPPEWKGARIGLVTNHAAVTHGFLSSRMALLQKGFRLVKLFSPEHGLDTSGADGRLMHDGLDPSTGLPIISLYSHKVAPTPEDLEDIDLVLFDIPDVGARFYTYLWTMTHVMEACAGNKKRFILADRPNPLSGNLDLAEGPLLDEARCHSFIGRWSIPVRHSCTLGELANYFNVTRKIGCSLEVVSCANWNRSRFYPEFGASFVPPSPAITNFESALFYPGLCFLEATNLSEGRGTALPFRVVGAPWMQAEKTAKRFNEMVADDAGGVVARAIHFTPAEGKYTAQKCPGIILHVRDPFVFRPVRTGWLLLRLIKDLHTGSFEWAVYPTQVNPSGGQHLDLLLGLPRAEQLFESHPATLLADIQKHTAAEGWAERVKPFLLYK
ncbi:MAG TPA: DUF1343 domain-containing protein [Puia sp.]|nr:DUF1343 domain-containing protein [Puia sp.]